MKASICYKKFKFQLILRIWFSCNTYAWDSKAWDSTGPAFFAKRNFAFFMTIASLLIYFLVLASQNLLRVLLLSNIPIAIYNFLIEWQVYFFLQFLTIFLHFFCKLLPKSFHNFLAIFFAIFLQTLAKKVQIIFLVLAGSILRN